MAGEMPVKITQGLLGTVFLGSGGAKLAGAEQMNEMFEHFRFPPWFQTVTGAVEIAAGASLLAGLRNRRLATAGGLLACGTMAGAVWTHLVRAGDPPLKAAPAGVLLGLSSWVLSRRIAEYVEEGQRKPPARVSRPAVTVGL